MDAPEVAQHVEMKRGGLDGFGPALAQAVEMPFGRSQFGVAQRGLLGQQLSRLVDVAGHEDAERDPKRIHGALVKADSSSAPSAENWNRRLIFLVASSLRFLSIMSPICTRLMAKETISIARCPSRSSRLPRVSFVT